MSRQTDRDPYRGQDPRQIPAYNTDDAAHYLRIPAGTIRNWAFGYAYVARGKRCTTPPLLEVADVTHHRFSFMNVVELHVLGALRRDHLVDMKKIRRAIEYLQGQLNSAHPLLDEEMETDGTDIFVKKFGDLINASREGQLAMRELLHAHLKRIERDEQGVAVRLFPFTRRRKGEAPQMDAPRIIAIDPRVAFGRPVISGSRVPTIEIFERFQAGEQPRELADDFARTEAEVLEAIRCESKAAA